MFNLHKYKLKKNGLITHTSFINGKYSVPSEFHLYKKFLFDYLDCKEKFLIERVSQTSQQTSIFKFFIDLDFDVEYAHLFTNNFLYKIYCIACEECREPWRCNSEVVMSIRFPFKIHLNFPGIIVDTYQALLIVDHFKLQLFNRLFNCTEITQLILDKAVDYSQYQNGGLRMLGSRKHPKSEEIERLKLSKWMKQNNCIYQNVYSVISFQIDTTHSKLITTKHKLNIYDLIKTSIRV
jgi:hypothetical protein